MNYSDLMLTNIIFNYVSKVQSGYIILDIMYMIFLSSIIFYIIQPDVKNTIIKKIERLYVYKTNRIKFISSKHGNSTRQKAIMYYLSKKSNPTIQMLTESLEVRYNSKTECYEDNKSGLYRVDQDTIFKIDKDINGRVYYEQKDESDFGTKIVRTEYICLEIYSSILSMIQLEKWVEDRLKEFEDYLQQIIIDKQLLFDIGYNPKEKKLDISYSTWKSNVTFENRFFINKEIIIDKINFFMNHPEWYAERGIPYTLGFLLWGHPGCGKTGFIKALMNYTGRHAISIKLNNRFDMNKLKEIMFEDQITELKIPQSKRIFIFEDIDCMGDVVHTRDEIEEKEEKEEKEKEKEKEEIFNNNLSYFLNILDGLQECPGRIIIMTTNKPEELDKALIRPGRIDHNIHFTLATPKDTINIIEFYWKEKLLEDIPDHQYSHAEIVNICRTTNNIHETLKMIKNN
jgi:ATP-dependent Zn protease